jgi:ABC-type multidrug transport system fused ATPase/permease subunit
VYFAYPGSQYLVLKNIKLDVKSGQNLALVGPSGGGKTSIASLIERFYDVVHGSIVSIFSKLSNFTI